MEDEIIAYLPKTQEIGSKCWQWCHDNIIAHSVNVQVEGLMILFIGLTLICMGYMIDRFFDKMGDISEYSKLARASRGLTESGILIFIGFLIWQLWFIL